MRAFIINTFSSVVLSALVALAAGTQAQATPVVTLPMGPVDGIPAQVYDEAVVYSQHLLSAQQANGTLAGNTSKFDFATGSGTIDLLIYSKNGVQNDAPFEDPLQQLPNQTQFDGVWGLGANGTVGALRQLLTIGGIAYQPMFYFDHNEERSGSDATLRISGVVSIYRDGALLHVGGDSLAPAYAYAFDTNPNGSYDQSAYVTSCGVATVGPAAALNPPCELPFATTSGTTYEWNASKGSGKADYFGIFPSWNLYADTFLDTDSLVIQISLRDTDSGFEELGVAGYLFDTPTEVPEPGSLALVALGLVAVGAYQQRRRGPNARAQRLAQ